MKQLLFFTDGGWAAFILRVTLSIAIFPHGAQKLLGWFGGHGYKATLEYFTQTMKLPYIIALSVIIIEFFGPVLLVAGLGSRLWAFLILIIMIGAITTTNYPNGFFMNWFGNQAGEGYEYHLIIIGLCIAIIISGSGAFSLDGWLQETR